MLTRGFHSFPRRDNCTLRWLLALVLLGAFMQHTQAQLEARPLSRSVVLVLKLVSRDRVQPTTGIVVSNDGLVMVPSEFISTGAEIIVLDGGTDIIKNGRPASILDRPTSSGWALLRVKGLERPGISLSNNQLSEASELHLTAFPPAEYIANGLPPLWADVQIQAGSTKDSWSISAETPQPYVTGPILDECGYLAGLSLSSGVQSIEPGKMPDTVFADGLIKTLNALQLELPGENCTSDSEKAAGPATVAKTNKAPVNSQSPQPAGPDLVTPDVYSPTIQRKRLNPFQGAIPRPSSTENRSLWSQVPFWLPLLGLVMLSVIGWKAWFFFRLRRQMARAGENKQTATAGLQAAATELQDGTSHFRSAPGVDEIMPDLDLLPPGCDGVLVVQVFVGSATRFNRYCSIDTQQFDLIIGKTESDININLPGIGNRHARLLKHGEDMTLSDLSSGATTIINGLPCLPGEIMYLENDAEICLGDALLRISIINKDQGAS